MKTLDRRHFIKITSGASIAIALVGCDSDDGDDDGADTGAGTGDVMTDDAMMDDAMMDDAMTDDAMTDDAMMDDGVDSEGGDACANGAPAQSISANHGHAITIPAADILAGTGGDYDITGTSPHAHMITLTDADMAALAAGMEVTVESTDGSAHTHTVTIGC